MKFSRARSWFYGSPAVARLATLALVFFTLTRLVLLGMSRTEVQLRYLPGIFALGFLYDLSVTAVLVAPFGFLAAFLSERVRAFLKRRTLRLIGTTLFIGLLAFVSVSEVVFWQEFTTRGNFIAVDYLLYTHEVWGNISQSYPMPLIFGGLGVFALTLGFFLTRKTPTLTPRTNRPAWTVAALVIPVLFVRVTNIDRMEFSKNAYANELSGNGLATFFAAARRNNLNYTQFYQTIDQEKADLILKNLGVERQGLTDFMQSKPFTIDHEKFDKLPFKRHAKNVILISVESFSLSFFGPVGNKPSLTPFLDKLASESLVFDHFFATGTRTVRGLEALSLGIPPIPGQSVVRRPENQNLSTLGEILSERGYTPYFIYGGYGYFDNMNAYFSANNYHVADRQDFPNDSIPFENIWGVADEALYSNGLRILDKEHKDGRPFFAHFMTTSNHRPFTYTQGRIDIPSPGGREGAVKYTDWAIGDFLERAKKYSWFKDTLFIITADHCHSVAGQTKLPVDKYRIPLYFYAPDLLTPGVRHELVSQIDLPPTILETLGVQGDDYFFGKSMFDRGHPNDRVFMSNYQALGYMKNDILTVLLPKRKIEAYQVDPKTLVSTPVAINQQLAEEAIAYYQTADLSYKQGALKHPTRLSKTFKAH